MKIGKRFLKITGIILGVLFLIAYFAFSTLLFTPHESDWEHDVSALIPRQVDFYVSKANLIRSFDGFPMLAIREEIQKTAAWAAFDGSPEQQALYQEQGIEAAIDEINAIQEQIPLGFTLLDLFGGEDLAIAGEFEGRVIGDSQWAVYGRVGPMGKLSVSMLSYPGIIGLDAQGISVEAKSDTHWLLSGGQMARPIHVARHKDVVLITTSDFYVTEVERLALAGGMDSVYLSGDYNDHVQRNADGTEVEVIVNLLEYFRTFPNAEQWPDPKSDRFAMAFLGRMIQVASCKNLMGRVRMKNGWDVKLHGEFTSEKMTDFQKVLYRSDSFDQDDVMRHVARITPDDATMMMYVHGPVEDLLREALASAEPALRSNLDDAFRSTGRWRNLNELVEEIGDTVYDRMALIVRPNDYGPVEATIQGTQEAMSPETDGAPVFAYTIILWTKGATAETNINGIRDTIGNHPDKFGLKGGVPDDDGYYIYGLAGMDAREFWSPFVPGTGLMITLLDDENRLFISNHPDMLKDMIQGRKRRLSDLPEFQTRLNSGLVASNLLVWFKPQTGRATMRQMGQQAIDLEIRGGVDWTSRRAREENEVLPTLFPGKNRNQLSESEESSFQDTVDIRLQEWFDEFKEQQRPVLMARTERDLEYLNAMTSVLLGLKLDPKSFDLSLQVRVPLTD